MTRTQIDFLDEKDKIIKQPKKKILKVGKYSIYLLIIGVVLITVFGTSVISSGESLARKFGNMGLWQQIKKLIGSEDKKLQGEQDGRINVLLLGIGGLEHDGPFLTDTMILASFKPETKQVALISIPRDLLAPIPGYDWRKINNANAFGESQKSGQGSQLAQETVSNIFDIPIHYYVRLDFAGFTKVIDSLGGITVDVENVLDDPFYPVKGKEMATTTQRYEHLYIEVGRQKFDGETALKYVRSRKAKGMEGSDFARSKRQQKVLLAVKEKTLSFSTLINPYRITSVMDTLSQHLATNFEIWELIRLLNLGKDIDEKNIIHRVFDDGPDGVLYSEIMSDGAFVLRPNNGDFSEMQNIVKNIFNPQVLAEQKPKKIEIQNGTKINGLASQISQYLESLGYQVIRVKNAPTQDYQKTVIYNLMDTNPPDPAVISLSQSLQAEVASTLPQWIKSTTSPAVSSQTDILIILGQDQQKL